jgi:hypothetical protein
MKPYHLFLFTAMLVFVACSKLFPPKDSFKAKLIASFCAFHIVQIEDGDKKGYGMDWTSPSGQQYKNVFAVKNHCDFVKAGLKVGDSFTAAIVDEPGDKACAVCFGYMDTPPLQWNIKVIQ